MSGRAPIGRLRRRLVLEAAHDAPDGVGGVMRSYLARATLWGEIAPVTATDRFTGQRMEQTITHRIRLRWRDDIDATARLRCGERLFVIHAVFDPDERRRTLECRCEEIGI